MNWKTKKAEGKARLLLGKLDESLTVGSTGAISYPFGTFLDTATGALSELIKFGSGIPRVRHRALVRSAIFEAKIQGAADISHFGKALDKVVGSYMRKPLKPYVLLTHLSVHRDVDLGRPRALGCYVTMRKHPPNEYRLPTAASDALTRRRSSTAQDTTVLVRTKSRDPISAAHEAMTALALLRGMWNLALHRHRHKEIVGDRRPYNDIVAGPIYTIHESSGEPASQVYWSDAVDAYHTFPKLSEEKAARVKAYEKALKGAIARSHLRHFIERLFVRYAQALDEPNMTSAFLILWSALEEATCTTKMRYDRTIRRASTIFTQPSYHRLTLDYLRSNRNRIVHEGSDAEDPLGLVNELRIYVEALVEFLAFHSSRFRSTSELGQFLDMPMNPKLLVRRLKLTEMALELAR